MDKPTVPAPPAMLQTPPKGWKEAKNNDDELIGYIIRRADAEGTIINYEEAATVIRLARDYQEIS